MINLLRMIGATAIVVFGLLIPSSGLLAISLTPPEEYNPPVDPVDFTTEIANPFFSIPVGKQLVYETETSEGTERIEILVPGWTREVMGVKTLVFWDRVWLNGQLVEDTRDYLAQKISTGDVWYFGEHVDNYEDGQLVDHQGAWIAGQDGAQPGIWMLANPQVNDEFRNEYYRGEAEDITKILAVDETVTVPLGTYSGCVKTLDWSPLFAATANKYYCRQVGGTALEVDLPSADSADEQRTGLTSLDMRGALNQVLPTAYASEGVINPAAGPTGVDNKDSRDDDQNGDDQDWVWIIAVGGLGVALGAWWMRGKSTA